MAAKQQMKSLAKDTAIYGVSTMAGKFLNWLLVPFYTVVLTSTAEYGIVTNLYAWVALLIVILTYGMETGFFRFANKTDADVGRVYSTVLLSVGCTSLLSILLFVFFASPIASWLGYENHVDFVRMMGIVVSIDAFSCIPFAYLRYKQKSIKFALLKLLMIVVNIGGNIFFFLLCPWLMRHCPATIDWFYNPDYGVGYVFVANLISTSVAVLALLPEICEAHFCFDSHLLRKMLRYSLPLLVLGVAGIMNQTVDKIIFPFLFADKAQATAELGIYGACYKIAMVMMVFTQAFRYAYEPFIFAKHKDKDSVETYADAMKYFIIFSMLILLGMIFYLDLFKLLLRRPEYWAGLRVVPIVLWAYVFQGIFFNLSLWYKLTDKTKYGAYFSLIGCVILLSINVLFVPKFSYMASAWASLACYAVMMLLSYFIGQKHLRVPYDLRSIGLYSGIALLFLGIHALVQKTPYVWLHYTISTGLFVAYLALIAKRDFPLRNLPVVGRFFRK